MDATKLRNSCICGNTLPYLECCGRYAEAVPRNAAEDETHYAFRHGLHELSMALFPLRALYQAYWEKLTKDEYPHDLLMGDADYGRAVMESFFWDYFVQYSDARPILRTARELEHKELRLAHDMMQWSYAPLWFYWVDERNPTEARLRNPGNGKTYQVTHGDRLPAAGAAVFTRLLPFRGREFCGHTVLAFAQPGDPARLEALFRVACRDLHIKPSTQLRPDVHGDEWRRHGLAFLALWRAEIYDAKVGRPARASGPAPSFSLALRDRNALSAALASPAQPAAPEVPGTAATETGPGSWDLRHRALRLARLEARGGNLQVTPADAAFAGYLRTWLRDRLGAAVVAYGTAHEGGGAAAAPGSSGAADEWVHAPLDALNGQTPIQASGHDWGRRRLQLLLQDMAKQGRDVTSLRRQLGL